MTTNPTSLARGIQNPVTGVPVKRAAISDNESDESVYEIKDAAAAPTIPNARNENQIGHDIDGQSHETDQGGQAGSANPSQVAAHDVRPTQGNHTGQQHEQWNQGRAECGQE